MERTIPLVFHGDDADAHRRRSFCVCTISSPLALPCSSWDNKILLYAVDTSRVTNESFDCLDSWMVHSLCELQEGRFFDVDPFGQPLDRGFTGEIMGGYRAVICAIKGDQKFLQRALKLKTSWTSERVCMWCSASASGQNMYTAFGPNAPHRTSLTSNESFITNGCHPNAWIRLPGFHVELVLADWLHLVDLSLTPEVAASVALSSRMIFFSLCVRMFLVFDVYIMYRICMGLRLCWNYPKAMQYGLEAIKMKGFAKHTFNSLQNVRDIVSALWMHYHRFVFHFSACPLEFVPLPPEETEAIFSACTLPANIVAGHRFNDCNVAWSVWNSPRKQMYPLGKNQYPTLVQKHFNGSVSCQINL